MKWKERCWPETNSQPSETASEMRQHMADQFETLESAHDLWHRWLRRWPKRSENSKVTSSENPPRIIHAVWKRDQWPADSLDKLELHVNRSQRILTIFFVPCDGSCSGNEGGRARRNPRQQPMRVAPCGQLPIPLRQRNVSRAQQFRIPSQPNLSWEVFHVRQSRRLKRTTGATGDANYERNGRNEVRRNWIRNLASSQRTRTPHKTEPATMTTKANGPKRST